MSWPTVSRYARMGKSSSWRNGHPPYQRPRRSRSFIRRSPRRARGQPRRPRAHPPSRHPRSRVELRKRCRILPGAPEPPPAMPLASADARDSAERPSRPGVRRRTRPACPAPWAVRTVPPALLRARGRPASRGEPRSHGANAPTASIRRAAIPLLAPGACSEPAAPSGRASPPPARRTASPDPWPVGARARHGRLGSAFGCGSRASSCASCCSAGTSSSRLCSCAPGTADRRRGARERCSIPAASGARPRLRSCTGRPLWKKVATTRERCCCPAGGRGYTPPRSGSTRAIGPSPKVLNMFPQLWKPDVESA
jgi:hypothetical protein